MHFVKTWSVALALAFLAIAAFCPASPAADSQSIVY